jgi:glycine cleavage system H protein
LDLNQREATVPEFLETTVDKFVFKVATDRLYNAEGVWAKMEGGHVRIGLSDFVQQHSGDVAFAEIKPVGTQVAYGDEIATIETIKVNISLASPVTGAVLEVNSTTASAPERINQDPFGAGWLVMVRATDWEADKLRLLNPQTYFAKMKLEAEQEVKKQ